MMMAFALYPPATSSASSATPQTIETVGLGRWPVMADEHYAYAGIIARGGGNRSDRMAIIGIATHVNAIVAC